jgi:hypothetical protein
MSQTARSIGRSESRQGATVVSAIGSLDDRSVRDCGVAVRWPGRFGLHNLLICRQHIEITERPHLDVDVSVDRANCGADDHFNGHDSVASTRLSTRLQLPVRL